MKLLILVALLLQSSLAFAQNPQKKNKTKLMNIQQTSALAFSTDVMDFTPCLKALSENTTVWKDKIFPLDPLGHTFLIKSDGGTMHVVGTKASYLLTDKPDCTTRIDPDPLATIQSLFNAVAVKDAINKKIVIDKCRYLPLVFQPEGMATTPQAPLSQ